MILCIAHLMNALGCNCEFSVCNLENSDLLNSTINLLKISKWLYNYKLFKILFDRLDAHFD